MDTFISVVIASLLVSAISFSGALLLIWKRLLQGQFLTYMVSFAAGIMLATAFIDLLPEALEEAGEPVGIFLPALLGVVFFFFLERFVLWFHHHDEPHDTKPSAVLILLGDGVHNLIDGVAIAAAYLINPVAGFATTLAIATHEVPQEMANFSVLVASGMSKKKALLLNFLSGLTALAGAVAGFYFLEKLEGILPITLAFTAGMFIYIACADLIPNLHTRFKQQKSWRQSLPFILGMVIIWSFVKFLGE